ncbi:ArnT family glycosyltransferase [Rhizobium oryzicola]|uniref:Glycosyltransferase family 39 protein n=1 Tax=Rhizobium oryzicola TaxID=1232668 RepID=A0ABT8ST52_9HYPH|nr:glycosyltransferase family 39 protein [Rhizobium oryzicola]MDO1581604.1 glycosyltransferase family 39 protein [Rhizobium oryzicola]
MITRTRNLLARRPDILVWLILGYFVLSVILRVLRSESLQNDEAEQAFQSQFLLLGYGRQPPFYNWLQYGFIHVFGLSVATLSALKNLLLFLTCITFGWAARIVLEDRRLALVTMLGVLAVPSVTVLAQRDLTHAIATFWLVALFLCALLTTLKRPSLQGYILTGIAVGFGIITKYNFVILPIAALLAMIADREFRQRLMDWRVIPAVIVALVICLPHLLWALTHFETATEGTIHAMREGASGHAASDAVRGLLSIATSTLDIIVPVAGLFLFGFWRDCRTILRAQSRWTHMVGLTLVICLLIVALIGVALGASSIREKWLSPFLLLLPLYLSLKVDAARISPQEAIGRMAPPVFVVIVGFIVYLAIGNAVAPLIGKYGKEHIPYDQFLNTVIQERGVKPAYVVTDEQMLAGNSRLELQDVPIVYTDFQAPLPLARLAISGPGLVIWPIETGEVGIPEDIRALFAKNGISVNDTAPAILDVPYLFSGGKAFDHFGYAWINPRT